MDALNMDDLTFNMASNIFPWTMKCSMFNVQCSMFNEPLLPPVGGRPGWGLKANSQSYNRYSYCLNNPLKYVDPSGYGYKPDDWDGKVDISPAYWIFFGGANQNHYVPGSGNHWSDGQRGEYGNFMLMSGQTFVNYYGQDAYDDVFNNVVNPQNNTNSIEPFNGAVYYLSLDNGDWTYVAFVDAEGNRVNLVESLEGAGNSINYFYLPLENGVDAFPQGEILQAANGYSEAVYWGNTINTLYGINAEKNLAENTSRANAYKKVTGRIPKSLRTATSYSKHVTTVAKTASRGLFVVGTALTVYEMAINPTAENLVLGTADIIMGVVSIGCPVVGLVYFTGRIIYDIASEE